MPRSLTYLARLVFAVSLLLPASLSARPRPSARPSRPAPSVREHSFRSAHHEPVGRGHHTASDRSSAPQIPQPARRPGSRFTPLPRTVSRINSRTARGETPFHPISSGTGIARLGPRQLRRNTPHLLPARTERARAQPLRTARTPVEHAPTSFGPAQATPGDFLEAASSRQTPAPIIRVNRTAAPIYPGIARASLAHIAPDPDTLRTTSIDKPELQSIDRAAATPLILPSLYNERGRLIVPAPLLGSREILLHQNEMADRDGLVRVQDEDSLDIMRERRMLLPLPVGETLRADERLPLNRRYSRPWTTAFLVTLARDHYARFHTPLQVNSAVRTVEFQQHLLRTNGNAAPAEGSSASPHLTGQAVDIAKHGLSIAEIAWLRGYLLPLIQVGSVDVEEEFQQSCFHISVYKRYAPPAPARYIAASRNSTSSLATAIR